MRLTDPIRLTGAAAIAAGLCTLLGCGSPPPAPVAPPDAKNVLLITMDTTRVDHLGAYGYEVDTSPNFDRLAANGIRFEMAISTSGLTPMAHGSIMTGLNPYRHGIRVFWGATTSFLAEGHLTLASILHTSGWSTGAFISSYSASSRFGLDRGFDTFSAPTTEEIEDNSKDFPHGLARQAGLFLRQREGTAQRRGDATTDDALDWLNDAPRPFFLWTHYFDPHDPSLLPPEEHTPGLVLSGNTKTDKVRIYDPEIRYMDFQIQRLLTWLEEEGLADSTVVVALADHGQGMNDHGWFRHRLLYQEQIRIPMVFRIPGGPQGQVVDSLARNIDVMPTVLEALDLRVPSGLDGRSLLPVVRGEEEPPRIAYAEALNTLDTHAPRNLPPNQKDVLFSVMDREWKLIHHRNFPRNDELYFLPDDPGELVNVAARHPDQVARLLGHLEQLGGMVIDEKDPDTEMSEKERRKLEALGYVGGGDD